MSQKRNNKKINCNIEQYLLWSARNEALNHKREPFIMYKQQKLVCKDAKIEKKNVENEICQEEMNSALF